jgi:DNA-binding NtrC family response regulator
VRWFWRAGAAMNVLIVESNANLGALWKRHLERNGASVDHAKCQDDAAKLIEKRPYEVIVLDLVLTEGSAFAVADYASYRRPDAKIIFVTNTTFFSDGSIFQHIPNACAFLPTETPPDDLLALVEHYSMAH